MVALEEAILPEIRTIPHPVRTLYDADCCPDQALPHLAWAFSVDIWNDAWPEAVKRAAIKAALPVHKVKGSVGAVRRALATLGMSMDLEEWFSYGGPVHTFRIDAFVDGVFDAGFQIDAAFVAEVTHVVDAAKPLRSHFDLRVGERMTTRTHARVGTRSKLADRETRYPGTRPTQAEASVHIRVGTRSQLRHSITHDVLRRAA